MSGAAGRMTVIEPFGPILRAAGLDGYEAVMTCRAGAALVKPGLGTRERIRLELPTSDGDARTFYLKRYGENAPARIEWEAVRAVQAAGAPTMLPVATGEGPAGGFVMVTAVPGEALSRCMDDLLARPDADRLAGERLAEQLGELAAVLHGAGLAHRDFYTAHIFADVGDERIDLYLIDLARVFRPRRRRWRWWLKDLAQLKFSLPEAWRRRYWPAVRGAYEAHRKTSLPWWGEWIINLRVRRMTARTARKRAAMERGRRTCE